MIYACIVGSGPSGVSAAHALLKSGLRVLLIDGGENINSDKMELLFEASKLNHISDNNKIIKQLYSPEIINHKRHPSGKLQFGSSFFYNTDIISSKNTKNDPRLYPSLAYGGYSNVWGGAILPYKFKDFENWPIRFSEIENHYKAILEFVPLTAENDKLINQYPLYTENNKKLYSSNQATSLLSILKANEVNLSQNHIYYGKSRLAVNPDIPFFECIYCGYCLSGCPRSLIYNSKITVEDFKKNPLFEYRGGLVVEKYEEFDSHVCIYVNNKKNNKKEKIYASKLYLGCGVISTAKLVLSSNKKINAKIYIKDSQYFIFPALMKNIQTSKCINNSHSLSQIFLEINSTQNIKQNSHLQIYTFNSTYLNFVNRYFKMFSNKFNKITYKFLYNILVIQGYLHSDYSSKILLSLDNNGKIITNSLINNETEIFVKELIKYLYMYRSYLGFIPIHKFFGKIGDVGEGSHYGCTFPMKNVSYENFTDCLGRLQNSKRVHIIDASVFPALPSGPITFTIMANAHRIATQSTLIK